MAATETDLATLGRARRAAEAVASLGAAGMPAPPPPDRTRTIEERYDEAITDPGLRAATRQLFMDGYHAEAVRHACMHVNGLVRQRSGSREKDGADLMHHAFSPKGPLLRLNAGKTPSDLSEQDGYRYMLAGIMSGLRNPRAHDPIKDDPEVAWEMLVMANHLVRAVHRAKRVRKAA